MREQIFIKLPRRIGRLIQEGIVEIITIKKGGKDITIQIKDDDNFEDDPFGEMENTIQISIEQ